MHVYRVHAYAETDICRHCMSYNNEPSRLYFIFITPIIKGERARARNDGSNNRNGINVIIIICVDDDDEPDARGAWTTEAHGIDEANQLHTCRENVQCNIRMLAVVAENGKTSKFPKRVRNPREFLACARARADTKRK